uniref:Uncharacterized protein n=1 Tax=Utricularia reniformis TaxID=192314 RepID=A0A1Y0B1E9_9LAMI|nr:hypothetical protein AEK19_MT1018 [Utricularia reniformis]ART31240.1 hypothetical protein AEK19_MT1018 [Utricularia reniformis]
MLPYISSLKNELPKRLSFLCIILGRPSRTISDSTMIGKLGFQMSNLSLFQG